jgi:hypothetical protein
MIRHYLTKTNFSINHVRQPHISLTFPHNTSHGTGWSSHLFWVVLAKFSHWTLHYHVAKPRPLIPPLFQRRPLLISDQSMSADVLFFEARGLLLQLINISATQTQADHSVIVYCIWAQSHSLKARHLPP